MTKKAKSLIDRDIFVKAGKRGGITTAKRGKGFYRDIGLKGSKIRWENKKTSDEAIPKSGDGLEKTGIV